MNKNDLVAEVAAKAGLSKADAEKAVDAATASADGDFERTLKQALRELAR